METLIQTEQTLHFSKWVNWILLLVLIGLMVRNAKRGEAMRPFFLRVLGAAVLLWVLASLDKVIKALRHFEAFPSTHMVLAVCVGTAIVALEKKLLVPVILVLAFYGAWLVKMHEVVPKSYHSWPEVLSATVLALLVTVWMLRNWLLRKTNADQRV